MKYGMVLLVAFMVCSGAAFASYSPKELWDKNATDEEKEALLVALAKIEAVLLDYDIASTNKARKAGINALKVCGYDNPYERASQGSIANPDKECYKAVYAAYKRMSKNLGDERPMVPMFLKGGAAAAAAAAAASAPEPPASPAKLLEIGSDSEQQEQPQGDGRMVTVPGAE